MPLNKTKKKTSQRKNTVNGKGILFVVALFFSLFLTITYAQQQQTLRQNAQTSQVTKPIFGCIGLGSAECTEVDTFVTDPVASEGACLKVESAIMEPVTVAQGEEIVGTIVVKNTCSAGVTAPGLFLKAEHSTGKIMDFSKISSPQQLIKDQTTTFTSDYKIEPDQELGEWSATFLTRDANNNEIPFAPESSGIKFTVIEPCPGLEVSKSLTLDKTQVDVSEDIQGSITYKNPCTSDYTVKNILIQVKKPGPANTTTIDDFVPSLGQITIGPGQEQLIDGSLTIPPDPCGGEPTCEWSAVGAYQTTSTDEWVLDSTMVNFTVGTPVASESGETPVASESASPAVPFEMKIIYFAFNKSDVDSQYFPIIDGAVKYLTDNPTAKLTITGHTDSVGSDAYNQGLSQRRADAVKALIVSKGIGADRLTTLGKGETSPAAPNDTVEGRDKNRRAEISSEGGGTGPSNPGVVARDDSLCTASGGTCKPNGQCGGEITNTLCTGGTDNSCCVENGGPAAPGSNPAAPGSNPAAPKADERCTSAGGTCKERSQCGGTVKTGLCPGGVSNICCVGGGQSSCPAGKVPNAGGGCRSADGSTPDTGPVPAGPCPGIAGDYYRDGTGQCRVYASAQKCNDPAFCNRHQPECLNPFKKTCTPSGAAPLTCRNTTGPKLPPGADCKREAGTGAINPDNTVCCSSVCDRSTLKCT